MSLDVAALRIQESIHIEPSLGFHRIVFTLHLTPKTSKEMVLLLYRFTGNLRMRRHGDPNIAHLFEPHAPALIYASPYASPVQVSLAADLSRETIERIEQARSGGDLEFQLEVNALNPTREDGLIAKSEHESVRIPRSNWLDSLAQLGYMRTVLLEIPIVRPEAPSRWDPVFTHLEHAQKHLATGQGRDAIGACRRAVDQLRSILGEGDNWPWSTGGPTRDRHTRLGDLRKALLALCQPADHIDPVAALFPHDRETAQSIIALTVSLIRESMASAPAPPQP